MPYIAGGVDNPACNKHTEWADNITDNTSILLC